MSSIEQPEVAMLQLMFGKHVSYSLSAVARLGVADHMNGEAVPVEKLAEETGAHAPSLYRVMRMLAMFGVFAESPGKSFSLTPLGATLKTDVPVSIRPFATMSGDIWSARAFENFPHTLRTGQDGITKAFGKNAFEVFAEMPEAAATFQQAMTSFSKMAGQAIANAYDFSGIKRLADVGGGHGTLLSLILDKSAGTEGVLYDLPEVIAGAPARERVRTETGSFFERVPAGCDGYILKHIIHDWSDELCRKILELIREQLPENGRVLVCEQVVPEDGSPSLAKMLDIEMLAHCVGGKERTESEFAGLFASAGLRLERVVMTEGPICVLEARRCI